jgi:hypothetical protein
MRCIYKNNSNNSKYIIIMIHILFLGMLGYLDKETVEEKL